MVILSEGDIFAIKFKANVMKTKAWEGLVEDSKVAALNLPTADHSFTSKELRDQVSKWTADWTRSLRDHFWLSQVLGRLSRPWWKSAAVPPEILTPRSVRFWPRGLRVYIDRQRQAEIRRRGLVDGLRKRAACRCILS